MKLAIGLLVWPIFVLGSIGCEHTTVSFGTEARDAGKRIVTTSNLAARVQHGKKQDFYFLAGPQPGTRNEFSVSVHSSDVSVIASSEGFVWIDGQYGKAESTDVIAYADHTRFVLQIERDVVRVFHYHHADGERVAVVAKDGSGNKWFLKDTSYIELKRPVGGGAIAKIEFVTTKTFKEDMSDLPADLKAFLTAVEHARQTAQLPDGPPSPSS